MNQLLAIALGGAAGAMLRHAISLWIHQEVGGTFPWGTLTVNFIGCFVIGLLFHVFNSWPLAETCRLFIFTGFLGALTTFSTYGLDTVKLIQEGQQATAVVNLMISNLGGIVLVIMGIWVGRLLINAIR